MDFLALKDIAEREMELVNPISPDKVLRAGEAARLKRGSRVVEYGCGYGEVLALWAERFGVSGLGIDFRPKACERARQKMAARREAWPGRIEIACADAAGYPVEPGGYSVAACVGASFIWRGFRPALQNMKPAPPQAPAKIRIDTIRKGLGAGVRPGGRIVIGEPYWRTAGVPPEYSRGEAGVHTEFELLQIIRAEGFDLEYVVRASQDDWDRYEAGNWQGLVRWLEENPDHPDRGEVSAHLRESQDEYLRYAREHLGWALYVLGEGNA